MPLLQAPLGEVASRDAFWRNRLLHELGLSRDSEGTEVYFHDALLALAIMQQARHTATITIWGLFKVSLPNSNDILLFCVSKPSAQTHTAASHCGSHCHQLRVCLKKCDEARITLSTQVPLEYYLSTT